MTNHSICLRALAACGLFALLSCKHPPTATDWREQPVEPNKRFLIEIDGTSDTDIWALSNDAVHHYDGARWDTTPISRRLRKVSVAGPNDVWFGGFMGRVVHYDGKTFEVSVIDFAEKNYWDVVTIAAWPGEVWVAFSQPGYFEKKGQGDWAYIDPPELAGWKVHTLWGKTKGDVWAGIERPGAAKVAHLQNGKWTIFDRLQGFGFGGSATNDVWFSGRTMVHWDGATLTDVPMPEHEGRIYGLAARSSSDALAVGKNGLTWGWDGTKWNVLPKVTKNDLDRVFAAPHGHYHAISVGSVWVKTTP
ncbi:MAG: hypothetical protein ABI551_07170 [Polyangiaceae bacterium]